MRAKGLSLGLFGLMVGCGSMSEMKAMQAPPGYPSGPQYASGVTAPMPAPAQIAPASEAHLAGETTQGNTEAFKDYGVNPFVRAADKPLSTFAIDVDTASYAIARRKLMENTPIPMEAVRAEEFVNYFTYDYPRPQKGPFAVHLAAAPSPFQKGHHIVRVGIQAKNIAREERAPVHLVYLVDVSGSMSADDRIGLAKKGLRMLTQALVPGDTVALCTYAGRVAEILPPTGVEKRSTILAAIDNLNAGGSTAMDSGIKLAYSLASRTLVKGHVNRVIVLSDGDANVGNSSYQDLLETVKKHRGEGITLSTVGFGSGNYKDTTMEQLADRGDGNYVYVDSEAQAKRVFVDQVDGLLQVVARDVKIQVTFDPKLVSRYRLIGYENRALKDQDFRNDKIDGGEVGAGHSVTALYDVELVQPTLSTSPLTVRVRHKLPLGSETAIENAYPLAPASFAASFAEAPTDYRFAVAVAAFADILRQSPHAAGWTFDDARKIAAGSARDIPERLELVQLLDRAKGRQGALVAK